MTPPPPTNNALHFGAKYLVAALKERIDEINALAVLADGKLASADDKGKVRIWVPAGEDWREEALLEGHQGEVNALAALADERLAAAGENSKVSIWALENKGWREAAVLEKHVDKVSALAVLADGRLACGGDGITFYRPLTNDKWEEQRTLYSLDNLHAETLPDGSLHLASDDPFEAWQGTTSGHWLPADPRIHRWADFSGMDEMGQTAWREAYDCPELPSWNRGDPRPHPPFHDLVLYPKPAQPASEPLLPDDATKQGAV